MKTFVCWWVSQFSTLEDIAAWLHKPRDQANDWLRQLLENGAKSVAEESLVQRLRGELFHVRFVRDTYSKLSKKESHHDWSKDLVFMAVAGIAFTLKRADLVEDILQQEVERHFEQEDHHPESMDYTHKLMTSEQILEMAVDRLSRNLQFNEGKVDLEQMLNFEPRMRRCPVCGDRPSGGKCEHEEDMLRVYWQHIYKHVTFVKQQWNAMVEGQMVYQKIVE